MIASILGCPQCNSLIMEDTAICPNCHLVLRKDFETIVKDVIASSEKYDGSQEIACRECQALNRPGLVRCWQCGAFMQEEMERIFLEMQARPGAVISSDELSVVDHAVEAVEDDDEGSAFDEDDFELSVDFAMHEATEEELAELPDLPEPEDIEQTAEYASVNLLDEKSEADKNAEDDDDEEDELLKLAVREERENNRQSAKRKRSVAKGSFLMKGPCGSCKIRVQNYHQGMMGQCPKCALPFMVPILAQPEKKKSVKKSAEAAEVTGPLPADQLIEATRWNEITLKKFKPKEGVFAGQGDIVDLIQRPDGLLLVWPEKKSLLGANPKQTQKSREQIASHLLSGKPLDQLPAARQELIPVNLLAAIHVVQPVQAGEKTESSEAGEPVESGGVEKDFTGGLALFGNGLIALEIPSLPQTTADPAVQEAADAAAAAASSVKFSKKKPKAKKEKKPKVTAPVEPPVRCLTLTLSQYRKLRGWLEKWTGQPEVLTIPQVPKDNITHLWKCVLSELEFESLEQTEWYQADPALPTTTVGWLCQCGVSAISETARKEQKFGGSKPAGLAKTKCPQCGENFGQHPLVQLTEKITPPPAEKTDSPETPAKASSTAAAETPTTTSNESTAATEKATADKGDAEAPETTPKKRLGSLFSRKK